MHDDKRGQEERVEYAKFLQKHSWDAFFTVTFRQPRKEPYYAMQSVWHVLERNCGVSRAFIGVEPHQSGDLHVHGLYAGSRIPSPGNVHDFIENPPASPSDSYGVLFKAFGRSKVERINHRENVTMYCAKYILKQQSRCADFYEFFGTTPVWKHGRIDT